MILPKHACVGTKFHWLDPGDRSSIEKLVKAHSLIWGEQTSQWPWGSNRMNVCPTSSLSDHIQVTESSSDYHIARRPGWVPRLPELVLLKK